jgi:hypothetical protein
MDTIDLFKQYVGKLNLRKTQLEAVTRIFKTCMESDDDSADPNASTSDIGNESFDGGQSRSPDGTVDIGSTTSDSQDNPKMGNSNDPSFNDKGTLAWGGIDAKKLTAPSKSRLFNERFANRKSATNLPSSDKTDLNKMSAGASEGKYDDMSKLTGDWRKVAEYQNFLNDNGFNISVDGKWGPETERAYQAYMAKTKNG